MDVSGLELAEHLEGEDSDETEELRRMFSRAEDYLRSLEWFPGRERAFFGDGVGGVVAVFLFELAKCVGREGDEWVWVVVGDLPSAHLVTDRAPDPSSALRAYCDVMQEWVNAMREHRPLEGVFPVPVAPTAEHADMLTTRIRELREKIIPWMEQR